MGAAPSPREGRPSFPLRPLPHRQGSPMTRSILHPELLIRVFYSGDDILLLLTWYRSVSLVQPKIILTRLMPTRQSPIRFTLVHGTYTYPFPSISTGFPFSSFSRLHRDAQIDRVRTASGNWSCPGWQCVSLTPFYYSLFSWGYRQLS
jgi:hypothetical protein